MTRLFLVAALLASATTASASVTYAFHNQGNFGTTDWQFTVGDFLSAPGTTFITTFDSYSSNTLGSTLLDVQMSNPFSATPFISTDTNNGALSTGGWVGPFDHAGIYTAPSTTLTITSTSTPAPEPSSLALIGAGGVLLALVRRRGWTFQKQIAR